MFAEKIEQVIPDIRAYARMLCRDRDLADDIVQNACLRAWNARHSFDESKGAFKAWMFTITRNEFLQHVRRHNRIDNYAPSDLENALITDCQLSHRAECSDAIRQLFKLNEDQRDVFILVVAVGYSYEEAAQICNCSVGTIKSRINRARAKLIEMRDTPNDEDGTDESGLVFQGIPDLIGYVESLVQPAA